MTPDQERRWTRGVREREGGHRDLTVCWQLRTPTGLCVAFLSHLHDRVYDFTIIYPPGRNAPAPATGVLSGMSLEACIDDVEQTAAAMGWDVFSWAMPAHIAAQYLPQAAGTPAHGPAT